MTTRRGDIDNVMLFRRYRFLCRARIPVLAHFEYDELAWFNAIRSYQIVCKDVTFLIPVQFDAVYCVMTK